MSPAGIRPAGAETDRRSPKGEGTGASESIEPACGTTLKLPTIWRIAPCPRREYVRREPRRIDEARRVRELERANQSNLRVELPLSCPRSGALHHVPGGNTSGGSRDG